MHAQVRRRLDAGPRRGTRALLPDAWLPRATACHAAEHHQREPISEPNSHPMIDPRFSELVPSAAAPGAVPGVALMLPGARLVGMLHGRYTFEERCARSQLRAKLEDV